MFEAANLCPLLANMKSNFISIIDFITWFDAFSCCFLHKKYNQRRRRWRRHQSIRLTSLWTVKWVNAIQWRIRWRRKTEEKKKTNKSPIVRTPDCCLENKYIHAHYWFYCVRCPPWRKTWLRFRNNSRNSKSLGLSTKNDRTEQWAREKRIANNYGKK